jgi:hypothetical protein
MNTVCLAGVFSAPQELPEVSMKSRSCVAVHLLNISSDH